MAFTVLTSKIEHETNTFSTVATDLARFAQRTLIYGPALPAAYQGTKGSMGATFDAAAAYGWVLRHPIAASATPSGRVTDAAFEAICDALLAEAPGADGVLLHLHGAMVTDSYEDGEGEILRRLRLVLGADVPIVVTLDLHGNITQTMADNANALIAVRTYPHIDYDERGRQGAALLQRAMLGEIRPRTVLARRPMLRGLDGGRTQAGPMRELIDRGIAVEATGAAHIVSVCAGFTAADIHDIGPSVTVTVEAGEEAKGQAIAESFMDHAWATRHYTSTKHWSIADATAHAKAGEGQEQPLVMADVTDNSGSGHYGDATHLLAAMVAADLQGCIFHAMYDPEAVQAAIRLGIGGRGAITMGGRHDPAAGGGPITLSGEVITLSSGKFRVYGLMGGGGWRDYGPSALFRVGGIDIILITNNGQATDLAQITSLGVDPLRAFTIAVKSNHHFRAAFEPIAREVITVNGGGLGHAIASGGTFTKVRRPIWPLDPLE
jgi:microcystin degradation protein MlrC